MSLFERTSLKLGCNAYELISDANMYIFFEKGMRGRVSCISNRYNKATNKYLKSHDPEQELKHIICLDVNNSYGCAMSTFLSTSRFKWIDPNNIDLNKYTSNSLKECDIEVDLEYPKELQELHHDYPFPSDKIETKREMLSNYQLKITDHYNIPIGNVKKLVPNFFDKEKQVIHYENLQFYLRLGLKLTKIARVLELNQSQWLKPYVEFNKQKRIEAERNGDKDEKALDKLMNNAIYKKQWKT